MPTALALLIAAIGRCRYCHGSGERCTACRNALATLEAAFRAASPIPYATRRARATAPPVRDTGHPWARP